MKYIVILICILLMGLQSFSQKRESCLPYKASRTITEFKSVILYGTDPFVWRELWPEYARLISRALLSSTDSSLRAKGKSLTGDQASMKYIMAHSNVYDTSFAYWRDYRNGSKVAGVLEYTDLKGHESEWVGFRDGDIEVIYAKLACANPQDPKNPPVPYTPPTPPPPPPPVKKEEQKKEEEKEEKEETPAQKAQVVFVEKEKVVVVREEPSYYRGYQPMYGYGYGQITISGGRNSQPIYYNTPRRQGRTGYNPISTPVRQGRTGYNPIQILGGRRGRTGG